MGEVKPLKYKELPGFSARQLQEHHDVLYAGYVKKTDEIREKLKAVDKEATSPTFGNFRELKIEETFAVNGVRLHEGYFDNLGGEGNPTGKIAELIKRDFGSVEEWVKDFKACGMSARGWVILAFDFYDNKLYNYICDVHNQGGVWGCIPLLILDVYEHAYFIDYATARAKYIEAFMKNIDWKFVNYIIEKYGLDKKK